MRFDLAALTRRTRNPRRASIRLRDTRPPAMFATDLYRALYAPIVAIWERAAPRIAAEYASTLSAMTADAPSDIQREIDAAQNSFLRLVLELAPELRDWVLRMERWQREAWVASVLSATDVDLATMLSTGDVTATLDTILQWNTSLITHVSDQTRQRISDAVFSGLRERRPAREVAKQISEATGMARDRSKRIAADQANKLYGSLADAREKQAGITVWEWLHSRKLHPRATHQARNGNYYSEDPAMVGREVDGKVVQAAPERGDRPGQPPYCGCRQRGVLVFD